MWWLWRMDGYGVFYSVPIFTLWIVWHGIWSDYRRIYKSTKWYHSSYAVEVCFRLFSELGFYTIFRWLISLNPPAWAPEITWIHVSYSWINFVVIKHIMTAYILLLFCHVLLSMMPVRRIFGLDPISNQESTTFIISASILVGLFLWFLDAVVFYLLFHEGNANFFSVMILDITPHHLFVRNFFIFICLISGLLISKLSSQKIEKEQKYRTLLKITSEGYMLLNPELKIVEVNDSICKMLAYRQHEIVGKTPFDLVDDENRKIFIEQTSKIPNTAHRSYEITLKKSNGEDLYTNINATTFRNKSGEVKGSFALITDVTDKKWAKKSLRESEEKYRAMMEAMKHTRRARYFTDTVSASVTRSPSRSEVVLRNSSDGPVT